jgi:branched-chain amino acid transport system ATP-binding protein
MRERQNQKGGTLSGGEQQMLAVARALMSAPDVVMLDEPSLGLAPLLVKDVFEIIKVINAQGKTVVLVEQNAFAALKVAHYAYVLETGSHRAAGHGRGTPERRAGHPRLSGRMRPASRSASAFLRP